MTTPSPHPLPSCLRRARVWGLLVLLFDAACMGQQQPARPAAGDRPTETQLRPPPHSDPSGSASAQPPPREESSPPTAAEPAKVEPAPAARYPFHEPVLTGPLPRTAPAMRYANLTPAACRKLLAERKLPFKRDRRPTPGVATAMRVDGPLRRVKFLTPGWKSKYGVLDCRLALTLDDLAKVLTEHDVARVLVGTAYRPGSRLPRSRRKLSQHGHALALDVVSFYLQDGTELNVKEDYHGEIGQPSCGPQAVLTEPSADAIKLRNLVCAVARAGLFHFMLTPNYDAAHHDHIHFDIKRDATRSVIR